MEISTDAAGQTRTIRPSVRPLPSELRRCWVFADPALADSGYHMPALTGLTPIRLANVQIRQS